MGRSLLASACNLLAMVRDETDSIGVGVSFGKDSLTTLDMVCKLFKRVEGYYLFRVANLDIVSEWREDVRRRHGVEVRVYPHFDLSRIYRNGVLMPHYDGLSAVKRVTMADIEAAFRADAQVEWLAYGWRRNDSVSRAIIMKQCGGIDWKMRRVFPLRAWKRSDVLDYLTERGIAIPPSLGRKEQGGLDFVPGALEELRQNYPADYERWLRDFPFSGVQLAGAGQPKAEA